MLRGMCDGIDNAIKIVTKHVTFWSDWNARIAEQLSEPLSKNLAKNNGQIMIGISEQSEEEWSKVEAMYKEYASTVSLPCRQSSAVVEPVNDCSLHRHGWQNKFLMRESMNLHVMVGYLADAELGAMKSEGGLAFASRKHRNSSREYSSCFVICVLDHPCVRGLCLSVFASLAYKNHS